MRTLTYQRVIDGVPVFGKGSRVIVHVGHEGEIVGATSVWKELEQGSRSRQLSKSQMKSPRQAEMELKARMVKDFGEEAYTGINNMTLAYYDGGKDFIQPAYFFEVKVELPGEVAFQYLGIIPALLNAPEQIEDLQTPPDASRNLRKVGNKPRPDNTIRGRLEGVE